MEPLEEPIASSISTPIHSRGSFLMCPRKRTAPSAIQSREDVRVVCNEAQIACSNRGDSHLISMAAIGTRIKSLLCNDLLIVLSKCNSLYLTQWIQIVLLKDQYMAISINLRPMPNRKIKTKVKAIHFFRSRHQHQQLSCVEKRAQYNFTHFSNCFYF